ncbi:hypothetical protein DSO57_1026754 [Entomophthora muscae]|uniref:Uncharacterized protein n=1 Tax=Entomophthora muscae TaxID=34485 RepID=A0ACC2RT04_9FUNG|nr:hypothetical protein DSO57_1026754 [Entomophthora muscae]
MKNTCILLVLLQLLKITAHSKRLSHLLLSPLLDRKPRLIPALFHAPNSLFQEIKDHVPYAAIVYCDEIERSSDNRNTKMLSKQAVIYRDIDDKETDTHAQVYLNKEQREIIATFRGSDTISKFFSSYVTTTANYSDIPNAKVHQSSLEFAESIRYQVFSIVAYLINKHPNFRIVLVGHSLGGNIATLMAPMLAKDLHMDPKKIRVITYGQLRVGNHAFAKHYNKLGFNFTRVVNKADPAANHPSYDDGWAHVNQEVYIDEGNRFFLCSTKDLEDPACSHKKSKYLAILTQHEYVADLKISPRGCGLWDFF